MFAGMSKMPICLACEMEDTELAPGCTRSFPEMLTLGVLRACIDIGIDRIVAGLCELHRREHDLRGAAMHRDLSGKEPS
jgi:hypothetical protein